MKTLATKTEKLAIIDFLSLADGNKVVQLDIWNLVIITKGRQINSIPDSIGMKIV